MTDKKEYNKEDIQELKWDEHIRLRPGMYIGGVESSGIVNLIKGFLKEFIEDIKSEDYFFQLIIEPAQKFKLEINSSTDISAFKEYLKEESHFPKYFIKATEILSAIFTLEETKNNNSIKLTFTLDSTIFKEPVDYIELSESLLEYAYLNKNIEILLKDNRNKYYNQNYFAFPEGIKYLYDRISKDALGKPEFQISFIGKINDLEYQIYLGYRTDWFPTPTVATYANEIHTTCGGSLFEGILEGLISGCREYVKLNKLEQYKIKKKKFNNGLILIAQVRGKEFQYGGSFKESLESKEVKKDSKKLIQSLTLKHFKNNKEIADKFLWRFDDSQIGSGMF
ncbi:MAG: DNA gyrase/topoisomerase IV subunit B [bacterium]|jgi:DNA gyrase/topoisomerase IV subunit B